MDFFDVVSVDEGREKLLRNFEDFSFQLEEVSILESVGRILGEDIYSKENVPQFNRSTMDGYAIKSKESHGATESIPSLFNIIGAVEMGKKADYIVKAGEAVSVPTGGMIPEGADGVVMVENTEMLDETTLMVYNAISYGENIILKGDDIKEGELALKKGRKITAEVVGVLAALGISKVKVFKKPKFYIISTGDEIVDLDEELTMGTVRDINSYTLYALINNLGGEVIGKSIVKDNYNLLREEVEKATGNSDIVLISGGSSVGTRDYTYKVINSFDGAGVFVHGVAIKPGKPTIIGEGNKKLIFGLPGHPVSSIMVFKAFVEYYIYKKMNINKQIAKTEAIIDFNFPSSPGRKTYQMVKLEERNGSIYAKPSFGKSGMISLLSNSDGYIIIEPYEEGIYRGEKREVFYL